MEHVDWDTYREEIRKESLENHSRLHRLFKEDRLSFERERRRMIEEVINSTDNKKIRNNLIELQKSWDRKMKKAGSEHNRFVLAQFILTKHIHEVWNPTLKAFIQSLNNRE